MATKEQKSQFSRHVRMIICHTEKVVREGEKGVLSTNFPVGRFESPGGLLFQPELL